MNGNRKGSSFERAICKKLSAWWEPGRDDIFWRSSQSGGRATERAKRGKKTFGSYGDIAAVDPIGAPLLEVYTIELKRGKSHGFLGDLIDFDPSNTKHAFYDTLDQVRSSASLAGSHTWIVISQRDRRNCMVYGPRYAFRLFDLLPMASCRVSTKHGPIYGMPLDRFLTHCKPWQIIKQAKELK